MTPGVLDIFDVAGKLTVISLLFLIAVGFVRGWLVPKWAYDREREMTDKAHDLVRSADQRVQAAGEEIRRFRGIAAKAVDEARRCKTALAEVTEDLERCKAEGGGGQ